MSKPDPNDLQSLRNIGPAMAQSLSKAEIKRAPDLRDMGADQAYIALLRSGISPNFIMYYVLHMALQGRAWNDCKGAEKVRLRKNFDQICTDHHDPDRSEFERHMDILGLRTK
ncbi:TfoX/Sxy family protein [Paracoccaceae bacterium]|nr:TfoX/Sxy family protein [Paracoccaceae bacterium]